VKQETNLLHVGGEVSYVSKYRYNAVSVRWFEVDAIRGDCRCSG
jgi:hypothetical protein